MARRKAPKQPLLVCKDRFGALRPADSHTEDVIRSLTVGEVHELKGLSKPRNLRFLRLYFALLRVVMDNLPEDLAYQYPTIDHLRWELMLQAGRFEERKTLGGKPYYVPDSISFASMDEIEFDEVFNETLTICARKFLRGADEDQLRQAAVAEIEQHITPN